MEVLVTLAVPTGDNQDCQAILFNMEVDADNLIDATQAIVRDIEAHGGPSVDDVIPNILSVRWKTDNITRVFDHEHYISGGLTQAMRLFQVRRGIEADLVAPSI